MNYGDTGGASRFFPTFRYCAKASRRERNAGCEERVQIRDDLTPEQRAYVTRELQKAGVAV